MAKIRIDKGRNGIIMVSNVNYAIRVFYFPFVKLPTMLSNPEFIKLYAPFLWAGISGVGEACIKAKISANYPYPKRFLIYNNHDDDYISIVFCYKIDTLAVSALHIGDVRFEIANAGFNLGTSVIYSTSYIVHESTGGWNSSHCDEAPIADVTTGKDIKETLYQCQNLVKSGYTHYELLEVKPGMVYVKKERLNSDSGVIETVVSNDSGNVAEDSSTLEPIAPRNIRAKKVSDAKSIDAVDSVDLKPVTKKSRKKNIKSSDAEPISIQSDIISETDEIKPEEETISEGEADN